jgi:hypothetical protein
VFTPVDRPRPPSKRIVAPVLLVMFTKPLPTLPLKSFVPPSWLLISTICPVASLIVPP